ncbi:MAG: MMPL family transporter [Pseudomonadota bacterium]
MAAVGETAGRAPAPWADAYARRIKSLRWLIVLLWAAIGAAAVVGGERVRYDPDVLVYFDENRPERQAFDLVEARFGQSREVVTLFVPATGDAFTPDILRAMARLEKASSARPEVFAVRSPLSEAGLSAEEVLSATDEALEQAAENIRALAAGGGETVRTLATVDGSVAAVAVIIPEALANDAAREVAQAHKRLKDEVAATVSGAELMQTGRIVIDEAFLRESQDDVTAYASVQLAVLAAIIFCALGSLSLTVAVMALVLLALVGTTGALGFSGMTINGISSAAPVVLMGLTVASAIHIAMAWQEAVRRGADKTTALAEAFDRNAKPVVLSILTTLLSFLILNTAEAPPFRDLGNIVAAGLLGILLLSFTLLPALLTLAPRSRGRHRILVENALGKLGMLAARRARAVIGLGVLIAVAAGGGISLITVDDTFSHYFDESYEIRRATDLFEEKLSGTTIIDVAVDTGEVGGALAPDALDQVATLSAWISDRPEVARLDSISNVRDRLASAGAPITAAAIRDGAEQLALNGVPRTIDDEDRHTRISIVMRGVSSRDTLDFRDQLAAEAQSVFPDKEVLVSGLPILSAQLSVGSARAMVVGMALALAAISFLLMATLRDVRLGLVSFVPNLLPVAIAFGIWGVAEGEVSFAVTVVAALTYGIVVDDTVHLLAKFQRIRAETRDTVDAIGQSFRSVGAAVVVTTLALAASFLPFALSGFLVNRHFGALTALTLLAALVADLLLLPALLKSLKYGKAEVRTG